MPPANIRTIYCLQDTYIEQAIAVAEGQNKTCLSRISLWMLVYALAYLMCIISSRFSGKPVHCDSSCMVHSLTDPAVLGIKPYITSYITISIPIHMLTICQQPCVYSMMSCHLCQPLVLLAKCAWKINDMKGSFPYRYKQGKQNDEFRYPCRDI